METSFQVRSVEPVGKTYGSQPVHRAANSTPQDEVAFENARALTSALQDTPAVRQEIVRRASELVGDVNYPPPETIRMISHLLAIQMHPELGDAS